MSQRIINIGTGPNTKDGDTVRQAFNLTNQNFTEVYNLLGLATGGFTDRLVSGASELILVDGVNPSVNLPNNLTVTNSGDISYIGKTITADNDALVGRIHIAAGDVRLEGYSDPDGANNTEIGSVRVAPGAVRLEISQEVVGSTAFSRLDIAPTGMALSSSDGVTTNTYLFDGNTLVLPNNGIIQHLQSFTRVTNGTIDPATPSVVWTGALNSISSVKLNIQVEGNATGDDTGWHVQGCEAVIVARWYGSGGVTTPQMSVFGVVYTSVAPLVTFTVQRNSSTNLIEVIATPTATANQLEPLYSKIYSVEMNTND